MNKTILMLCFVLSSFWFLQQAQAQKWIPSELKNTTLLVERYRYQDPDEILEDVDDMYEDEKEAFIETTNNNTEQLNKKLVETFKAYKKPHKTVPLGKINELYPDKKTYRFVLKREPFFGKKKALNTQTKKTEDESYFAYRYFFYDRLTRKEYMSYYFSGSQWEQVDRMIFWLNSQ